VQCGAAYHLKLAIADDGDAIMDSAVFLESGSFSIPGQVIAALEPGLGVEGSTINVSCVPVELTFERQGDLSFSETVSVTISGSATPGVDYSPALPALVNFAAGDSTVSFELDVTLDDDGPEDIILTITELMGCANASVSTVYSFNILSPAPLEATGEDVTALCGDVSVLAPVITGGVGGYEFLWSTGETTPSIVVSPGITTFYDFTVTNACSTAPYYGTLIVNLPDYDPMDISVSPATEVDCLEEEDIAVISTTGGNGDYDYSWTVLGIPAGARSAITIASPNGPLWYIVEVTDGCGSSVEDSVLVSPVTLDPIVITASDGVALCQGDSVVLHLTEVTGGSGGYTYEWTNLQGAAIGHTNELQVHVTQDQQFTISVTDQCGLVGDTTLWARSPVYAPFVLFLTPDITLCAGDSVELHAVVAGGSGSYSIQWDEAGGASTDPMIVARPEGTTTYSVSVTDHCGAILSGQVEVSIETVEVVILVENLGGNKWHLRSASTPLASAQIWDMGDGVRYRQDDVFHDYLDVEEHWAFLSITTPNGCEGIDSVLLSPPGSFFFPNAFTPDGDGANDTFGPIGNDIHAFEMTIYNRWGEVIYSTTSINDHWTGTVNGGEIAATGVYVYKYRLEGRYLRALEGIGHVTLLRGTQH
jgi:gliding motility-associated-like protein